MTICDVKKDAEGATNLLSGIEALIQEVSSIRATEEETQAKIAHLCKKVDDNGAKLDRLAAEASFVKQVVERIRAVVERISAKCFPQKVYSERDLFLFMACRRIFRTGSLKSGKYWGPYTDEQLNHKCPKEADVYQHVIAHLEQLSNGEFKWLSKADRVTWRSLKTKYRTWEREQKASQ